MGVQSYVLAELEDFSILSSSLKSSQRIKFTCVDASQRFIVLGATSGGIYVFQRKPCIFLQLIPNTLPLKDGFSKVSTCHKMKAYIMEEALRIKEGAITQVSVSPNENMFAFSTVKGFVFLVDHNILPSASGGVRRVQVSSDHHGAEVTAFKWNQNSNDLYIGDDKGKISVASVSFFMAKTIFQAPSFTLMELDSKVVQMDLHGNYLLVSTLTRCYVCDTVQEQYKRIGSKPRNGIFGACFQEVNNSPSSDDDLLASDAQTNEANSDNVRIFCARPGARLWEVAIDGDVVSTHKFGEVLTIPPVPLITINRSRVPEGEKSIVPGFTKLFTLGARFLFTYEHQSVYVMDPENAHVVLWSQLNHEETIDARTVGNVVYLWSGSLLALTLLTIEECLLELFSLERFDDCINLCLKHLEYLNDHAQCILPLGDLRKHVASIPEEMTPLMTKLSRLIEINSERVPLQMFKRLETGMHVMRGKCETGIGRTCLRDAIVRSRSASPRTNVRKVNSNRTVEEEGKECRSAGNHISSATFSSLPDFAEGKVDPTGEPIIRAEVHEEEVKGKGSSKNSIESSMKLVGGTIKEKWQELGGKVRSFGWDSAVETTAKPNSKDNSSEDLNHEIAAFEDEVIVNSRNSLLRKSASVPDTNLLPKTKSLFPILDLGSVMDACTKIEKEEPSSWCCLFDSFLLTLESFSGKSHEFLSTDIVEESDDLAQSEHSVLSFPFKHYFGENVISVLISSIEALVRSDDVSSWLEQKFGCLAMKGLDIHPVLEKGYASKRQIQDDLALCALIDPFLEIIDPLRILECLGESSCPCRYLLWCKLVELVIAKPNERLASNLVFGNGQHSGLSASFPFLLTKLQRIGQSKLLKDTPKILREEKVPLRHCLYIIFWLYPANEMQDWCSVLLSVLALYPDDVQDDIYRSCAVEAFIKMNYCSSAEAFCVCGFPRRWAPSYSSPRFARVGVQLARSLWSSGRRDSCLSLCWKTGLWRWLIWFLRARYEDRDREWGVLKVDHMMSSLEWDDVRGTWSLGIISLLATFADRWCLKEWLENMDAAAWKKFLAVWVDVISGNCQGCQAIGHPPSGCTRRGGNESVISWTDVGHLMSAGLGAEESCALLWDLNGVAQLDVSFYRTCILATVADCAVQDRHVAQALTRMILNEDTSSKAPFSPKVAQMVEDSLVKDTYDQLIVEGGGKVPFPPSKAAANHHWGQVVSFGRGESCPRCSLPLASKVLLAGKPGGILVLPCGHSVHAVCVRSVVKQCPLGCPPSHSCASN